MPIAPIELVDGEAICPTGPGHGGDPRPDLVDTFRIDRGGAT
jgi:hypothetical protein